MSIGGSITSTGGWTTALVNAGGKAINTMTELATVFGNLSNCSAKSMSDQSQTNSDISSAYAAQMNETTDQTKQSQISANANAATVAMQTQVTLGQQSNSAVVQTQSNITSGVTTMYSLMSSFVQYFTSLTNF